MSADDLFVVVYFGVIALVLAAIWVVARWSRKRHIAKYGPAPPGSAIKTFGLFVAWCAAFAALLSVWEWGPYAVFFGGLAVPHLSHGFDDRAWGPWQRFRDAGVYALVIFVPAALLVLIQRASAG